MAHRIVTSKYYRCSLIEVQQNWSIDDVDDAYAILDFYDEMEYRQMRAMRKN